MRFFDETGGACNQGYHFNCNGETYLYDYKGEYNGVEHVILPLDSEPVACQVEMAVHTKALLDQLCIPTYHFHKEEDADELPAILNHAYMARKPVAVLMDASFWKGY